MDVFIVKKFRLLTFIVCGFLFANAQPEPLIHAHSHNDYVHLKPLYSAYNHRFKSIEIDVFAFKGQLKVAHVGVALSARKDIEQLYFKPADSLCKINQGHFYTNDSTPTIFMIEFKNKPDSAYYILKNLIEKYSHLFCKMGERNKPLQILITGGKPYQAVISNKDEYLYFDGGIGDTASTDKRILRLSSPFGSYFKWRGIGKIPENEKQSLLKIVRDAQAHQRQVRFYQCPQNTAIWRELLDAGVDWINIDNHKKFSLFYQNYRISRAEKGGCHCIRM